MPKVSLMVDSGAYSAWSHNEAIDLKAYIRFLKEHRKDLSSYVALDVLPVGAEKKRTAESVEASAKQSYNNFCVMRDAGLKPIPVFHQGDDFKWLELMLKEGESYIGFSCRKDLWARDQSRWLDDVFSIITTSDGRPIVKTHGFGITKIRFIQRYPWSTVDSTSWSLMPAFGQIYVPPPTADGSPDYLREPLSIATSGKYSKSLNSKQLEGFENAGMKATTAYIFNYVENVLGVTPAQIRHSGDHRRRACLIYLREMSKHVSDIRFQKRASLWSGNKISTARPVKNGSFRIMHATVVRHNTWSNIMNDLDIDTRLLSFYDLLDLPDEQLQEYITKGTLKADTRPFIPKDLRSEAYRSYRAMKAEERLARECDNDAERI